MARIDTDSIDNDSNVTGWVGWVYFAGFMMCIIGAFQIILGMTALLNDEYYIAVGSSLLVADYTTWGWFHLLYGIIVLMAGMSLFSGRTWARVVGTILASFNLLMQFSFVSAYPIWSIIMIVIDILIIYALTVHGREVRVS